MPFKDPSTPEAIASAKASRLKHYYANKEQYSRRNKEKKEYLQSVLRSLKEAPCTDCKIQYPYYVMQYDHTQGNKTSNVGNLIANGSEKKLLEEIAKCELVCANCHAERTHNRGYFLSSSA